MTGQLLDNIAEQDNIAQAVVNHEDYETFGIAEAFEPSDPMVMASRRGALPPYGHWVSGWDVPFRDHGLSGMRAGFGLFGPDTHKDFLSPRLSPSHATEH